MAPAAQLPSGVSPGFATRDSVASQSGAPSQTSSVNGSSNSNGPSTGDSSSANTSTSGLGSSTTTEVASSVRRSQEKVIEVSDKELASEAAKNQNKSEVTKKFEPSSLSAGVASIDEVANTKTSSKVPNSPPINPVTDAAIAPDPRSNSPSNSSIPSQKAAAPETSPIPSATSSQHP
jgi:hypothetical protein